MCRRSADESAYHATKFAAEGLTEALQYELEGHGKRVKLIEPGGSKTNFDSSSSMVRTPHPAYEALIDGFDRMWEKESAKLPSPEKWYRRSIALPPMDQRVFATLCSPSPSSTYATL
jgi:NAD(P)-dependent dehydrogenase (short-subunit alcohol dehydrogenase family)